MLSDLEYLNRALDLAERGRGTTSPNPMVGAVVVRQDGTIVGQGYHERAGEPHAEIHALNEAGGLARGATLYCTLEPCSHTGRTGPCVERIVAAGIARVIAATRDPDERVSGRGFDYLRRADIAVSIGVGRERAIRLNRAYFAFKTERRPFVIMKAATSIDNRIAAKAGARTCISSHDSLRHSHAVRAEIDAIAVGSGTVLADDPLLTAREIHRRRPLIRVLFDRRLRTPPSARVFSTLDAGPVIIVTTPESLHSNEARAADLRRAGAELEPINHGSLREVFGRLGERQIVSLVLEGGVELQAAAWAAGVVDAVHLYVAPMTLGPDAVSWLETDTVSIASLVDRTVLPLGSDVFMEGYVHGID
ncbi:MAG TPA: bifunctional diaminohydroxyphosphoribosylaminopyrimidine deaminase/5-amino-6-(5-phosphoribosylamino)uracil reductase RibD [Vicinamibacterales bacterium]|nr:bifunctional diaminohydroxyphosphoribosylaminopyrimidine deaminase/5-amino-6-(5-phosphoribosylamino)uracil reductase RibD [Vicinamibacterales bacterium]